MQLLEKRNTITKNRYAIFIDRITITKLSICEFRGSCTITKRTYARLLKNAYANFATIVLILNKKNNYPRPKLNLNKA